MRPWEVFNPKDGRPVYVTRWEWVAHLLAWWHGMDYAREGDGW